VSKTVYTAMYKPYTRVRGRVHDYEDGRLLGCPHGRLRAVYTAVYTVVYTCTRPVHRRYTAVYTTVYMDICSIRVHGRVDGGVLSHAHARVKAEYIAVCTVLSTCTRPAHGRIHVYSAVYTTVYTAVYRAV